jgi:hypothetical protein
MVAAESVRYRTQTRWLALPLVFSGVSTLLMALCGTNVGIAARSEHWVKDGRGMDRQRITIAKWRGRRVFGPGATTYASSVDPLPKSERIQGCHRLAAGAA